ncbi:MFS transporter [Burkholderia metallica]|uniref:MFS transporter n=1 Tax=Burkholderia metallica TaxID=488729 RepID=UPI0034A00532
MVLVKSSRSVADRHSFCAALTLALCAPGDTLLYLLLPMHTHDFGVGFAQAGILLGANRLVRIAGYAYVLRFYCKHGDRTTSLRAALATACCAFGYATLSGFWAILVLRLMWGMSFAALNLSAQVLATADPADLAHRVGRSRAVFASGPMLALPVGAALTLAYGPRVIFFLLGGVALLGVIQALRLPGAPHPAVTLSDRRIRLPDSVAIWSFMEGVILDGLFIVGLSTVAEQHMPATGVVAAGVLLALRYAAEMLLSPLGGHAAHRWGAVRMLVVLSLLSGGALIGYGSQWFVVCGGGILVLRALQLPLVTTVVAQQHPTMRVQALASNAVWRDIGSGIGPLIAGFLLPVASPMLIYSGAAIFLSISALLCGLQYGRKA